MTQRECFRRICRFQKPAYIPNYDMGFMPVTLARWRDEGMPEGTDVYRLFGFDHIEDMMFISFDPIPGMPNQTHWQGILSADGKSRITRDAWGTENENVQDEHFADAAHRMLKPGVISRGEWDQIKGHFRADEPKRFPDHWEQDNWQQKIARWKNREHVLALRGPSMIGQIKEMMGFENYALMLYDDLPLLEEIMETQTRLAEEILPRAFREVEFDCLHFWEDIAYRGGPILPPDIFEKIATPRYKRLADLFRSFGGEVISVDSDGDIRKLIPGWLKGGINHLWPLEPFSGMDVVALREEYGQAFTMRGGIDKFCVSRGKEAIDRELDRIFPVVQEGGYIPHLDHQNDNMSFENYCYYMEKKREMLRSV
jgi:hypothetical protein